MWDDEQPSAQIAPQTPEQMAFFRKTMALFALGGEDEPFGSVPFDDSAFVQARTELAKRAAVEPAEIDELFTEWKPLLLKHHRSVAGLLRERETKFSAKRRRRSKRWIFKSRRTGCRHLVQQIDAARVEVFALQVGKPPFEFSDAGRQEFKQQVVEIEYSGELEAPLRVQLLSLHFREQKVSMVEAAPSKWPKDLYGPLVRDLLELSYSGDEGRRPVGTWPAIGKPLSAYDPLSVDISNDTVRSIYRDYVQARPLRTKST